MTIGSKRPGDLTEIASSQPSGGEPDELYRSEDSRKSPIPYATVRAREHGLGRAPANPSYHLVSTALLFQNCSLTAHASRIGLHSGIPYYNIQVG
jgi:hypothetical protein